MRRDEAMAPVGMIALGALQLGRLALRPWRIGATLCGRIGTIRMAVHRRPSP